jgi:hypothetical protein
MKFAQDLYPSNSAPITNNISPATNAPVSRPPTLPNLGFLNNLDLSEIVIGFNRYVLVWTLFVSMMYVANFYFYYLKQGDSEIARESVGEKCLWIAARIWWRYLPSLVLFVIFGFSSGIWTTILGLATILALIIKLWQDVYTFLGITDYFTWYNGFAQGFRSFLSFQFVKIGKKKK